MSAVWWCCWCADLRMSDQGFEGWKHVFGQCLRVTWEMRIPTATQTLQVHANPKTKSAPFGTESYTHRQYSELLSTQCSFKQQNYWQNYLEKGFKNLVNNMKTRQSIHTAMKPKQLKYDQMQTRHIIKTIFMHPKLSIILHSMWPENKRISVRLCCDRSVNSVCVGTVFRTFFVMSAFYDVTPLSTPAVSRPPQSSLLGLCCFCAG